MDPTATRSNGSLSTEDKERKLLPPAMLWMNTV